MVYPGNSGSLVFLDENFVPREFTLISDGLYENKSLRAKLVVENNLSTISFDSGKVYSFNDAGKIAKIADKNGNNLAFQYDEEKKLTKTIDTLGREIIYVYNTDSRLQEIVDFTGKKGLTLKEFLEVILLYNIYLLFFCLATSSWCIFGLYYYSVVTTSSSKRNNCCCGSAEESFDLSLLLLVYSSC